MPHRVIPKDRVCETCRKKFKGSGQYLCKEKGEGEMHDVAPKQYFSPSGGLQLQWKADKTIPDPTGGGGVIRFPGKTAQFIQGMYTTTDPEEQDFMDDYPGLVTREKWEEIFIPEKMRQEKRDRESRRLKTIVEGQNAELVALRNRLGLDPETGAALPAREQ